MPPAGSLPDRLKALSRRNGIELRNTQFGSDAERLIRSIKSALGTDRSFPWVKVGVTMALVACVAFASIFVLKPESPFVPSLRQVGDIFRDCVSCPEMIVVPAGRFSMGAAEQELSNQDWARPFEKPVHDVRISRPFAVGRFAITRDQFEEFVLATNISVDGGCHFWGGMEVLDVARSFRDPKFTGGPQNGDHPVVCVSHHDAMAYVTWLSSKTGHIYRLLSDAEREYVTRAGTTSAFWWGPKISPEVANYWSDAPYNGAPTAPARFTTLPVNFFKPNPWGLFQVHGNVAEWVADCWHPNLAGAPSDGTVWEMRAADCNEFTVRGGSFTNNADLLRSAHRRSTPDIREITIGFRVAQTLP